MTRELFLAAIIAGIGILPAFADVIPSGVDPETYRRSRQNKIRWQESFYSHMRDEALAEKKKSAEKKSADAKGARKNKDSAKQLVSKSDSAAATGQKKAVVGTAGSATAIKQSEAKGK